MKVEILQELRPYSFAELQEIFHKNEILTQEIIKSLSVLNIVRKINKYDSIAELEELLDIDEMDTIDTGEYKSDIYVFKYVGVIMVDTICLIIYPKYLSDYQKDRDRDYIDIRQILSVIKKYRYREQKIGGTNSDISNFNLLSTALELIEDYHENGLYRNYQEIIEVNGNGGILWEKTINESQVYFSNNRPFYLDVFSLSQVDDRNDYFRRLHSVILTELSTKFRDVFEILNIGGLYLTGEGIEDFGNIEYIINNIDRELTTQFVTKRQKILKRLKRYLLQQESYNANHRISLLGTSSFNLVWEDVCSVVMENNLKTPLKELGLTYSENEKQSALLLDVVSKPVWKSYEHSVEHKAKKTLTPDIVSVKDELVSIYDAKYYKIILNKEKIDKQPGVEDVSKQYLYELALRKLSLENDLKIKINAFLIPTDSEEKSLGSVKMDIFEKVQGINAKKIDILMISARKVYRKYLNS